MHLTREYVLGLRPCLYWRQGGIDRYLDGRESVTAREVLTDESGKIERCDQRWLAARLLIDRCGAGELQEWLAEIVERAIRRSLGRSGVPAWEAWAEGWIEGEDRSSVAALAARRAATVEAKAARAAAQAAAASAALAAVDAMKAVVDAGRASLADGDWNVEHRTQMEDALRRLEGDHAA